MERGNDTGSSDSFGAIVLLLGGCEGELVGGGGGDISEGFAGGGECYSLDLVVCEEEMICEEG